MPSPNARKRPAPGSSSSAIPLSNMDQNFGSSASDPLLRWNAANNDTNAGAYMDGSHSLGYMPNQVVPATPSTVLARRQANRALIPTHARPQFDSSLDWANLGSAATGAASMEQQPTNGEAVEEESLAQLEARALKAKRDAEAKRKQIPPFVQKLSSFLERGKNQDLIRWSEKGDSFIVVDEDEFAKKLIPELFKHNNYASFVRQLNMYGFHKRVGLSDNSMRASERKGKSPNEYENKYFIKGHPNLLWLITKPKNSSKKKGAKAADGEDDSDDDLPAVDNVAPGGFPSTQNSSRALPPTDLGGLPTSKDLVHVRDEFRKIREYQSQILQRLQVLEQNQKTIQKEQATEKQNNRRVDEIFKMYAHHEQVMKQMMGVLVYHYNKTHDLEDPNVAQQQLLKDIMQAGYLPTSGNQSGIFELNDEFPQVPTQSASPLSAPRKARGLLEAPPSGLAGNVQSGPASAPSFGQNLGSSPDHGQVTEIFDTPAETPASTFSLSENDELLNMMGASPPGNMGTHGLGDLSSTIATTMGASPPPNMSQRLPHHGGARSAPSAPNIGLTSMAPLSMSSAAAPAMHAPDSHSMPAPSIPPHIPSQDEIDTLRQLSENVGTHINNMSPIIVPLSPSGRLPGFPDGVDMDSYFGGSADHPPDFDINQFIHDPSQPGFDTSSLFNFDPPAAHHHQDGSASSLGTANLAPASPSGTEEISRDDVLSTSAETPTRGTKRRRVN